MKLHPNPEPTTYVIVRVDKEVPRCPVETYSGLQCRNSTIGHYSRIIDGKQVPICALHYRTSGGHRHEGGA